MHSHCRTRLFVSSKPRSLFSYKYPLNKKSKYESSLVVCMNHHGTFCHVFRFSFYVAVLFLISIKEMKAVISLIVNKCWICYITWGSDNMWACVCPIRRWSRLCLWGRPCCCLRWERGWSCFTPCCLRALTDGRVSPKDRYPLLTSHTDLHTVLPVRTSLNWTMNWIHIENGEHFNWSVPFIYLCDKQWSICLVDVVFSFPINLVVSH